MSRWKPNDPENLLLIERMVDGEWRRCLFVDLRKGDMVRAYSPDGVPVHPITRDVEADEKRTICVCAADPIKYTGFDPAYSEETVGWCCEMEEYKPEWAN